MTFLCQSMLNDRQLNVAIDGTGTGWFTRGQRLADFRDVTYARLNYQLQVQTGTGSVGLRIDWQPSDATGIVSGSLSPLIPDGPTVANGDGLVAVYGAWTLIDQAAIDQGDLLLRLVYDGTPSLTFLVNYVLLMYR